MEILERCEVDRVVADFPVGFATVFEDGWQFIAYYNKDRHLTVAGRKVVDGNWQYKVLPTQVGLDTHCYIAMTVDRENCLHVSGNMHADPLVYYKMQKPYDIASFEPVVTQVLEEDELRCTYPKFMNDMEGRVVYAYRKGGSGNGITIMNRYDEETKSFERLTDAPLFDGLDEMSAYQSGPGLGPDGHCHVIWVWRDTPHCETNHDLSYATSRDLIHWKPLGGSEMEAPITPRKDQFTVDPVPAKGGAINGAFRLFFDGQNNPLIVYMKYDDAGKSQLYVARSDGGDWQSTQVSQWDYRWEFSGPGSIDFEIQIGRADFVPEGHIVISYWHVKKGHGELHLDGDSLMLMEDRAVTGGDVLPYPEDLLASTGEEMFVKWLPIKSTTQNEQYVLRWETMGKRRFYEPREEVVDPSELVLYKFSVEK